MNTDDGRGLWIPGPTWVRPEVLFELARPMVGHRTREVQDLIASLDPPLMRMFGADAESHAVGVHSATASALMEAGLRAVGPRVLCVVNGAFSRRFLDVARALGKDVTVVETPLGTAPDLVEAGRLAREAPEPFDAITVCASETSSGAFVAPVDIGAKLVERRGALLLVDVVTLLGGGAVRVSDAGVDFAFAGTQKALALPPGLGLYAASLAMLESATRTAAGSWFLDLAFIHQAHAARKPPMTPTIPLLRALAHQLGAIMDGALEDDLSGAFHAPDTGSSPLNARFARHAEMARRTRAAAQELGLEPYGGAAAGVSPTITCLDVAAAGLDPAAVLSSFKAEGFVVGGGYGDLKASCIRIGHMGDHPLVDLDELLAALRRATAR